MARAMHVICKFGNCSQEIGYLCIVDRVPGLVNHNHAVCSDEVDAKRARSGAEQEDLHKLLCQGL